MRSYTDLFKRTPLSRKYNARSCKTRKYKAEEAMEDGENMVQIMIRSKDPKGSGRTHTQVIRYFPDKKKKVNKATPLWVSCGCEDWKFVQEYAVWVAEATSIIHCNGNFPKEKNKLIKSGLCKHLIKAIPKALKTKPKVVKKITPLSKLGWTIHKV